jgi:hypothetical protein
MASANICPRVIDPRQGLNKMDAKCKSIQGFSGGHLEGKEGFLVLASWLEEAYLNPVSFANDPGY